MNTNVAMRYALILLAGYLSGTGMISNAMQEPLIGLGIEVLPALISVAWKYWEEYRLKLKAEAEKVLDKVSDEVKKL